MAENGYERAFLLAASRHFHDRDHVAHLLKVLDPVDEIRKVDEIVAVTLRLGNSDAPGSLGVVDWVFLCPLAQNRFLLVV